MTSLKPNELLVVCLCADWCGACREYKPLFDSLALKFPTVRFLWIDVEDEADLIDPIEVENFPTILIAKDQAALFLGTVLPHIETLERLIAAKNTVNIFPDTTVTAHTLLVKRLVNAYFSD